MPSLLLVALCLAQFLASGCSGRGYEQRVRVHTELLVILTADAVAALEQRVAMPEMLGMRYALDRARGFAVRSASSQAGTASLLRFKRLVADYEALVNHVDRTRVLARDVNAVGTEDLARAQSLGARVAEDSRALLALLDTADR